MKAGSGRDTGLEVRSPGSIPELPGNCCNAGGFWATARHPARWTRPFGVHGHLSEHYRLMLVSGGAMETSV